MISQVLGGVVFSTSGVLFDRIFCPAFCPWRLLLTEGYYNLDDLRFNNAIFYVMSGTGNTYRMACWMKEIANPYMEDIKIVMIEEKDAGNQKRRVLLGTKSVT